MMDNKKSPYGEKRDFGYFDEKPTDDKVEPKFKVGDWVVYYRNDSSREVLQVYDIRDGKYYFTNNVHFSWSVKECDEKSHLWTIQDAKDGDVLIDKSGGRECPFIFKETKPSDIKTDMLNPLAVLGYCGIGGTGFTKSSGWGDTSNCIYYPATKEQRDLLFQKMKEAGYEWDAEKKELKKIVDEEQIKKNLQNNSFRRMFEQKQVIDYPDSLPKDNWELTHEFVEKFGRIPKDEDELNVLIQYVLKRKNHSERNEEDETYLEHVFTAVKAYYTDDKGHENPWREELLRWLKALKDRIQPQPKQEWSEEDEKMFKSLKTLLNKASCYSCTEGVDKILAWLKQKIGR
jgi:hypothetical protein